MFRVFLVFFEFFFFKEFGVGARGVIFESFSRSFGARVLNPCSWPGVSQSYPK